MGQPQSNTILYDSSLVLHTGAVTTSAVGSVAELDIGAARFVGDLVINISAIDVASNNETYKISLQGSTASGFASGVQVPLFEWTCGDASTITTAGSITTVDTQTGVYRFPVTNELFGLQFRYVRIQFTNGGTTPSITSTIYLTRGSN